MDTLATLDGETAFPMDPAELADAIGIPLEDWPLHCATIAAAVLERCPIRGARLARGHWHGEVASTSAYPNGVLQHSWILCEDGRILDPTRWAIVSPDRPFIYLGDCDDYDEGGLMLRQRIHPQFPTMRDPMLAVIDHLSDGAREDLAAALRTSLDTAGIVSSLKDFMREDPDRAIDPEAVYRVLAENGLKGIVPLDSWMRVMEPEALRAPRGTNMFYELPPMPERTEAEKLFVVLNRFLCIEDREGIEDELAEIGYELERDLWNSLNEFERYADLPIKFLPRDMCDTLSVIVGDLLGKGFGETLRVERFASSIGLPPAEFDSALRAFGGRSGYDLSWDIPSARTLRKAEAPAPRPS